jgi:mediator of RNA polymerase II transcription subunit 31
MDERDRYRFQVELEFVQCLSNPKYVHYLAQNGYMQDPGFLRYLEYLRYWSKPKYSRYLLYDVVSFLVPFLTEYGRLKLSAKPLLFREID